MPLLRRPQKEKPATVSEGTLRSETEKSAEERVSPEVIRTPEQFAEGAKETPSETRDKQISEQVLRPIPVSLPVTQVVTKDTLTQEIEDILAEDLTDLYLKMTPSQQELFREKGEETAGKIRELLIVAKVNARKVLDLIRSWLKMIPGVNRFFLEQEAKIKTDKILDAANQRKH